MPLALPAAARAAVLAHAHAEAPYEAIGVLLSSGRVVPLTNVAPEPVRRSRYEADPAQWLRVSQQMEDRGESVAAVYHSHPRTPAVPSGYDVAHAAYPGAVYLIVTLLTTPASIRAWRIDPTGGAVEVPL